VSPQEIPALEARLQSSPNDAKALLRLGAALLAAGDCDSAVAVATRGTTARPDDALGPLVIGSCHTAVSDPLAASGAEDAALYSQAVDEYRRAVALYDWFLDNHGGVRGAGSVSGKRLLTGRAMATAQARAALSREQQLPQPNLDAVAVLPLTILGDSTHTPLSRGLAQLITSDLALLQRFRMVERMQLGAILDELNLGQSGRVDPGTAARVGNLVQAGRMVQGLATISEEDAVRLEANVVLPSSEVVTGAPVTGRFRALMDLEKQLVVNIASEMGYVLSAAEENLLRGNGTRNLTAFLSYSLGLVAEDSGRFADAAGHYSQAVLADPSFQQARVRYQAARSAPAASGASQNVVALASEPTQQPDDFGVDASRGALQGSIGDIASTYAEQNTEVVSESSIEQVSREGTATTTSGPGPEAGIAALTAIIRIIFTIP
jgi:tetratricopeptide (TPR) repeat protein